jgi:hypothetical protein
MKLVLFAAGSVCGRGSTRISMYKCHLQQFVVTAPWWSLRVAMLSGPPGFHGYLTGGLGADRERLSIWAARG